MPDEKPPSLAESLRKALPEAVSADETTARSLEAVADLERKFEQLQTRSAAERAFLERAPREGMQYPADALKLIELPAGADERALAELYAKLRRERPYVFGAKPDSPGNEKLALLPELERMREAVSRDTLTRDMQSLRDAVLRRRRR